MSSQRSQRNSATEKKEKGDPPIFTRRHWTGSGSVEVAVFDRVIDKDGEEFRVFNIVAKRTWKDGDKYESGNSFRPEDILVLAAFLQESFLFISNEQTKR